MGTMSRAFLKEGDGADGEPLAELRVSPHRNLVTAEGLAQIEAHVDRLRGELSAARAAEDRAAIQRIQRDLRYWSARRATAQLTEPKQGTLVQFGSCVTIRRPDGATRVYRIVGIDEGNPKDGTLSYVSPLAQALMGKEIGETVVVGANEEEIIALA